MRLFNSHKSSPSTDPLHQLSCQLDTSAQESCSRYEPEVFAERRLPADPYLEWVARRAEERERDEQPAVRWVYRHENGRTAVVH